MSFRMSARPPGGMGTSPGTTKDLAEKEKHQRGAMSDILVKEEPKEEPASLLRFGSPSETAYRDFMLNVDSANGGEGTYSRISLPNKLDDVSQLPSKARRPSPSSDVISAQNAAQKLHNKSHPDLILAREAKPSELVLFQVRTTEDDMGLGALAKRKESCQLQLNPKTGTISFIYSRDVRQKFSISKVVTRDALTTKTAMHLTAHRAVGMPVSKRIVFENVIDKKRFVEMLETCKRNVTRGVTIYAEMQMHIHDITPSNYQDTTDLNITLCGGETVLAKVERATSLVCFSNGERAIQGLLLITNFRLKFLPYRDGVGQVPHESVIGAFDLPYAAVTQLQRDGMLVVFTSAECRTVRLTVHDAVIVYADPNGPLSATQALQEVQRREMIPSRFNLNFNSRGRSKLGFPDSTTTETQTHRNIDPALLEVFGIDITSPTPLRKSAESGSSITGHYVAEESVSSFPSMRGSNLDWVDDLFQRLEMLAFPPSHPHSLFAFRYKPPGVRPNENGWFLYKPWEEWLRLGLASLRSEEDAGQWRILKNSTFNFSPTYPKWFVVPAALSDEELLEACTFRSKGRLPVVVWRHPVHKCVLVRGSQPCIGIAGRSSLADQKLLRAYRAAGAKTSSASDLATLYILDARKPLATQGNKMIGKGVEDPIIYDAEVEFLGLANIHKIRESINALSVLLEPKVTEADNNSNKTFLTRLQATGWLKHVMKILAGAVRIALLLQESSSSVVVHCSDGWDRTPQLTATAQLLLDPYYRTIKGFAVLIEKEFCSFGHKFSDRIGVGRRPEDMERERSPIMLQWLDVVYQVMRQFPSAFEFDEKLLLHVSDSLSSGLYGTFLCNTEKERTDLKLWECTVSVWTPVLVSINSFLNPRYQPVEDVLWPRANEKKVVLWESFFFRYDPENSPALTTSFPTPHSVELALKPSLQKEKTTSPLSALGGFSQRPWSVDDISESRSTTAKGLDGLAQETPRFSSSGRVRAVTRASTGALSNLQAVASALLRRNSLGSNSAGPLSRSGSQDLGRGSEMDSELSSSPPHHQWSERVSLESKSASLSTPAMLEQSALDYDEDTFEDMLSRNCSIIVSAERQQSYLDRDTNDNEIPEADELALGEERDEERLEEGPTAISAGSSPSPTISVAIPGLEDPRRTTRSQSEPVSGSPSDYVKSYRTLRNCLKSASRRARRRDQVQQVLSSLKHLRPDAQVKYLHKLLAESVARELQLEEGVRAAASIAQPQSVSLQRADSARSEASFAVEDSSPLSTLWGPYGHLSPSEVSEGSLGELPTQVQIEGPRP